MLKICEIYSSILGESSLSGYKAGIVRLTGCNLRCSWCDTKYAYDEGRFMEFQEIVENLSKFGVSFVLITGGEPLLQKETLKLLEILKELGYYVIIETNGSFDISVIPAGIKRIVDFKPPGSGMESYNLFQNADELNENDEVKFVVASYDDFLWAKKKTIEYDLHRKAGAILISPAMGILTPAQLAEWLLLEKNIPFRLNLQLHKLIWGDERGR
ncbi:MAG: radical SAM protein [bacterium]